MYYGVGALRVWYRYRLATMVQNPPNLPPGWAHSYSLLLRSLLVLSLRICDSITP